MCPLQVSVQNGIDRSTDPVSASFSDPQSAGNPGILAFGDGIVQVDELRLTDRDDQASDPEEGDRQSPRGRADGPEGNFPAFPDSGEGCFGSPAAHIPLCAAEDGPGRMSGVRILLQKKGPFEHPQPLPSLQKRIYIPATVSGDRVRSRL